MLMLIDKLLIAFIYVNILAPRRQLFPGLPLGHSLMAMILLCSFLYILASRQQLPKRIIFYISTSFAAVMGLALIGLMLGNSWENISDFPTALLILGSIPALYLLFDQYRPSRYATHVLTATFLMSILIIYLYIKCGYFNDRDLAGYITDNPQFLTSVSYPGGTVRVSMINAGFLPGGLLIAADSVIGRHRWYYYPLFIVLAIGLILSQTMGLVIAGLFAVVARLFYFDAFRRFVNKYKVKLRSTLLGLTLAGVTIYGLINLNSSVLNTKKTSINEKLLQSHQAIEMFLDKPLFGSGLGYSYRASQFNFGGGTQEASVFLESSYAMMLSSTGIIGIFAYSFIYLFYVFNSFLLKLLRSDQRLYLIAHLSVLISGIGNPYIWSGGLGLFYACFLAASVETQRTIA